MIKYEIDEDTKELLTETLGLAQRVIDLQYDDEMADLLQDMLEDLSERFDIKVKEVKVTARTFAGKQTSIFSPRILKES